MNDADRASLQDFLAKLRSARLPERDPEAGRLIEETFQVQPDAAQLLTIKCLLQQRALDELRGQIEALQQQLAQAQGAAAAELGSTQDRGWFARLMGAPPRRPVQPPASAPAYGQAYAPPAYAAAPGGSLLGSIATTAAGVAAGEFLFEGVEHLLHGGRGYGYGYAPGAFMDSQPVVENVTINEFGGNGFGGQPQPAFEPRQGGYGSDGGAGFQNASDTAGFDDGGFDDSFSGGDGDISI